MDTLLQVIGSATDPLSDAGVALFMVAVTWLRHGCRIGATRIDPIIALRTDWYPRDCATSR